MQKAIKEVVVRVMPEKGTHKRPALKKKKKKEEEEEEEDTGQINEGKEKERREEGNAFSWHSRRHITSNRQLPADVTKTDASAEENAGYPGAHGNAFLCDAYCQRELLGRAIQAKRGRRAAGRCWHQLRLQTQEKSHSSQSHSHREEKSGSRAINQIPQDGIGQGEGHGGLRGRFPRKSSLNPCQYIKCHRIDLPPK